MRRKCWPRRARSRTAIPRSARSPDRTADCRDRRPAVPRSTRPARSRSPARSTLPLPTPSTAPPPPAAASVPPPAVCRKPGSSPPAPAPPSAENTAPYGAGAPTARRKAGSNAPTASGRYSAAISSRITLLAAAICSSALRSIASTVPNSTRMTSTLLPRHATRHNAERERDQIERHQPRVAPRPLSGDQPGQRRHGKPACQPAERQPGRRRPRIQKADRGPGHHRMSEHVAIEAHPPQHQQRADGPIGQRQRQARHQRRAHEPERLERRRRAVHAPTSCRHRRQRHLRRTPGNAAPRQHQRRWKPRPHQVEIMQYGDHGPALLVPSRRPDRAAPTWSAHRPRRTARRAESPRHPAGSAARTVPAAARRPTVRRSERRQLRRQSRPFPPLPRRAARSAALAARKGPNSRQPPSAISSANVSGYSRSIAASCGR